MTLRSLSSTLEVSCDPYHIRFGHGDLEPIQAPPVPAGFVDEGWTVLRLPSSVGQLSLADVGQWLASWGDAGLLFLDSVESVELLNDVNTSEVALRLAWQPGAVTRQGSERRGFRVTRRLATGSQGGEWVVYSAEVPTPSGVERAYKAAGSSVPVAVAFSRTGDTRGYLHVGLPLVPTGLPFRVHSQFDPLTSRQGLAATPWNDVLQRLLIDFWLVAVSDLFDADPQSSWRCIPLTEDDRRTAAPSMPLEDAFAARAAQELPAALHVTTADGQRLRLGEVASEVAGLEGVLTDGEIANLAGLKATLPHSARDVAGRWRVVLGAWRSLGSVQPEVTVRRALSLVREASLPPERMVPLLAAAIGERLGDELVTLPCLVTDGLSRICPPSSRDAHGILLEPSPLADRLQLGHRLHGAHLAPCTEAGVIAEWLQSRGAVLDPTDAGSVLRRVADAGWAGNALSSKLGDGLLLTLRDLFEELPIADRDKLGVGVGRAVRLDGFRYDSVERRVPLITAPADAYLPRAIDHGSDSFCVAAARTEGIVWLDPRYAAVLQSPVGRGGLGALKFLRLLGAETGPRVRPHEKGVVRYTSDSRKGVAAFLPGSPVERGRAVTELQATYTLDDYECPDLQAVVEDIARDRSRRRHRRAAAVLATLGRAWGRLSDVSSVVAAKDYMQWNRQGETRAYWLWACGGSAWLSDGSGKARRPVDLRIQSAGTVAIYGSTNPDFIDEQEAQAGRRDLLEALSLVVGRDDDVPPAAGGAARRGLG